MVHYDIGNIGHVLVIISFVFSLAAAISYGFAANTKDFKASEGYRFLSRILFFIHGAAVLGVVASLFVIIYQHYFEYHYAFSHSSRSLPVHYMISCFWEGQEGSFLLWIFWHVVLGFILIFSNRKWESHVMFVFCLVQVFLTSMIMGVVIPGLDLKLGSSPFMLLRDVISAPIFLKEPEFVPADGNGLNPLLQNYWMVIHPPTLFLGFALTLIPFAYSIAGLWKGEYKEWVRPALPWALFSALVLGIGILMGAYWAYETLNFGGYWNWDPVENAVYVPWLVLVASYHTMITFKKSSLALKSSFILVITTFLLVLYSTFLTRSGVLGNASVHSFTDLGLSGQLLIYMVFFMILSIAMLVYHWKKIPTTDQEVSVYSREFWIFIGATVLCLMGFQVLAATSIPVYNKIAEVFGTILNMAIPADQVGYYSNIQIYFAMAIALLSGTGQFFFWQKMDKAKLKQALTIPLVITLILSTAVMILGNFGTDISYLLLLIFSIYSIVANGSILLSLLRTSPGLSGGSIAHIGIAMMLIGILYSSGYSKVVSLNNSGLRLFKESNAQMDRENVLLWLNQPREMDEFTLIYKGPRKEIRGYNQMVNFYDLAPTRDKTRFVLKKDLKKDGLPVFAEGDTVTIYEENTYYEVEYYKGEQYAFTLYPRAQVNPDMGLIASPDIKHYLNRDLYTHVSAVPDPNEELEWSEWEDMEVSVRQQFFLNDFVATLDSIKIVKELEGIPLVDEDFAVLAYINVQGSMEQYQLRPILLIKEGQSIPIPDRRPELGLRLVLTHIAPETRIFTFSVSTTQKDYIVLKAIEKPMINVLWIGTLVMVIGFIIAIRRRYREFRLMRDKASA